MALPFWDDQEVGYTGPDYLANPHDTAYLGKLRVPGLVALKISRVHRLGKQKAPGRDGATKILRGMEPSKVEMSVTVWTPSQYRLLDTLTRELFPPPGKKSKNDKGATTAGTKTRLAYDIRHPEAERMGVTAVIPFAMTSMVKGSKGEQTLVITFEGHHEPPKNGVAKKIKGSSGDAPLGKAVDGAYQSTMNKEAIMSEYRKPNG